MESLKPLFSDLPVRIVEYLSGAGRHGRAGLFFLLGVRYLAAAVFMSGTATWSAELFASALSYIGPVLLIAAIAALVVGLGFLAVGIAKDCKNK